MLYHNWKMAPSTGEIALKRCARGTRGKICCLVFAALFLTTASVSATDLTTQVTGVKGNVVTQCSPESRDYWPTESWRYSTPESQGMDSVPLEEATEFIRSFPTDSLIIVRHGYIVYEQYFNGMHYAVRHHLQSATKSIASILIGIALDKGFIENVDQKVVDFFPGWQIENLDSRKQNMTLRHLLTMTTGLAWDEWSLPYEDPRNSLTGMHQSSEAAQYVLNTPMACEPGEKWVYCSGASLLLGAIIQQVSNCSVASFAREFLFDPIGVGSVAWHTAPGGYDHTGGGLFMTPRDVARLGYLLLNNGTWDGREIVSATWVAESTNTSLRQSLTGSPDVASFLGYGYQWWTYPDILTYFASGYGGQRIYVVSRSDLVVVFLADPVHDGADPSIYVLEEKILPSVLSEGPLPERTQPYLGPPIPDFTGVPYAAIVAAVVLVYAYLVSGSMRNRTVTGKARMIRRRS